MVRIDTDTMFIGLTRGDTINLSFSAKEEDGTKYLPVEGDVLTLAVAKKLGGEKLFSKSSEYGFSEVEITESEFNAQKDLYYTKAGEVYTRCDSTSSYSALTQYYTQDMWNVNIEHEDTEEAEFGKYVWDCQIASGESVTTIIGKTDNLSPTFQIWGEVAE